MQIMQLPIQRHFWLCAIALFTACEPVLAENREPVEKTVDYVVRDVPFKAYDGVELFGRLVLPGYVKPRAVVIYVQTAEGMTIDVKRSLGRNRTFNYFDLYRDKLTAMEIGFFTYEGRGVRMGEDPPRYETIDREVFNSSTLENKVRDILSAIEVVRLEDGIEHAPILLMGASEGALLAAEAASRNPDSIAGLVLYGALVTNLKETFTYIMSDGEFLRYRPLDENKDGEITRVEWDRIVKGRDFAKADLDADGRITVADIRMATKTYLDAVVNDNYEILQAWARTSAAVSIPDGWFRDHFNHPDSWTYLSRLHMPVGYFHGDADNLAPISAIQKLEKKTEEAGLANFEFHYFAGLDHSLNIGYYFFNGELPEGHQAIFQFIDRVVSASSSAPGVE